MTALIEPQVVQGFGGRPIGRGIPNMPPSSRKPKVEDEVFRACSAGRYLATKSQDRPIDASLMAGADISNWIVVSASGDMPDAWQSLFIAMYWFAASHFARQIAQTEERKHLAHVFFGAESQRALTLALLGMGPRERRQIFSPPEYWDPAMRNEWTGAYIGAASVAYAANGLRSTGISPALPTTEADIQGVDLMGRLPTGPLLCLQVKTPRKQKTSQFVAMTRRHHMRDRSGIQDARTRELLERIEEFAFKQQINALPGVLKVGQDNRVGQKRREPWEIDETPFLSEALGDLCELKSA